ncbi:MAG: hypothetical protein NZ824_05865 [Candidatus Thioglobus sp.]|nr:hypothetical protein [Candidatus Thioglobus sp.]
MDTFVLLNLLVLLIILTAGAIDVFRNRKEYTSWKSYRWVVLLSLAPICLLVFYLLQEGAKIVE